MESFRQLSENDSPVMFSNGCFRRIGICICCLRWVIKNGENTGVHTCTGAEYYLSWKATMVERNESSRNKPALLTVSVKSGSHMPHRATSFSNKSQLR